MSDAADHLARDGAAHHAGVLDAAEIDALRVLADAAVGDRPGRRVNDVPHWLERMLAADGAVGALAASALGAEARPVRLLFFDKSPARNWAVGWHQDRTIAVRERREVDGFGPWTVKDGVPHVAPPAAVLARMVTLRVHLDACGEDNAPLLIAPGSHALGAVADNETSAIAARLGVTPCLAAAGDVWLYRTLVLHASERAQAPARRRVMQVDYAAFTLPGGLEWLGVAAQSVTITRPMGHA